VSRAGVAIAGVVALALGGLAPTARAEDEAPVPAAGARPATICRIQIGGHVLTGETDFLPPGYPGVSEARGGVMAAFGLQFRAGPRAHWGLDMDLESNQVDIGEQTFYIATVRILGTFELPLVTPGPGVKAVPYGYVGAGWNSNRAGAKFSNMFEGAPTGTATGLQLDESPAVRAGFGLDYAHSARLAFTLDVGWKWNRAGYVLTFLDEPDRTGNADLGGVFLLGGIKLMFTGPTHS